MGSSGMGVDANGKPIKRQHPQNNKKKPGNNQKKGNNNNKGNNKNQVNRGGNGGNGGRQPNQGHPNRPMPLVPPFAPMGPSGFAPMPPPGNNFNFFGPNMNRRGPGGGKNNGNRNGAQQPGYNGPSAANVGQGIIGNNIHPFGVNPPDQQQQQQQQVAMDVPGFGKNSNIHELFGKMIWRKMEQIQDSAVVDQLQNRIMNLIHDALAGQAEQQQQQRVNPFGAPTNQKGAAFNNNSGASGFARMF